MKDSVLLIYIYICVLLAFSLLIASMVILYPEAPNLALYADASTRIADIFLYSLFSLLPLTSVISLLSVIFTVIKRGYSSFLDFLVFVFLCCVVWLLIIPFCYLYEPADHIAFWVNKGASSPAAQFFKSGFFSSSQLTGDEALYFSPPALIREAVSNLFFLSETIRFSVDKGRNAYLLLASAGFSLASVYSFYSVSYWKLMNAVLVILFWAGIFVLNLYMHSPAFTAYAFSIWVPLIVNLSLGTMLWLPAVKNARRYKKKASEA